ncbi:hypothetical protein GYMLUDRAFT_365331 [Collybiopsis luxurians FD-317 M1]|nr:hypothetical protein GYMLUDRAFT_365331 [Collybiopsis luxurians FD-317 M1]
MHFKSSFVYLAAFGVSLIPASWASPLRLVSSNIETRSSRGSSTDSQLPDAPLLATVDFVHGSGSQATNENNHPLYLEMVMELVDRFADTKTHPPSAFQHESIKFDNYEKEGEIKHNGNVVEFKVKFEYNTATVCGPRNLAFGTVNIQTQQGELFKTDAQGRKSTSIFKMTDLGKEGLGKVVT